ncbi:MAG: imelysin family protein [Amaricoccus sp.]|nr:imelysin family protein [Amaricoccus sp.]MBP7001306.1 imelysin family protein [Amaricoccus sp.]
MSSPRRRRIHDGDCRPTVPPGASRLSRAASGATQCAARAGWRQGPTGGRGGRSARAFAAVAAALGLLAGPAGALDHAAVAKRALEGHILPRFDTLAADTAALATAAQGHCAGGPEDLMAAYNAAFDAWMGVAHLRFGPLEEGDTGFAIAFWPDERSATPRALAKLEADQDPVVDDPARFAQLSVAARGLFALDALLAEGPPAAGSYECRLVTAVAVDLAATAAKARDRWRDPFAGYLATAGAPGNPLYLTPEEGSRAIFTALAGGLEVTADHRLGRPLGTFEKPQPRRAEAWRTGRPQRDVILSVAAARSLYETAFAPELSAKAQAGLEAAFVEAEQAAAGMGDVAVAVTKPGTRIRVESAQQAIRRLRTDLVVEVGGSLGIAAGFNSMDGD